MKQEKTLQFDTEELSLKEAATAAKEVIDEKSAFNMDITSRSNTHMMVKSSGTKVSIMSMGTELRVHIEGSSEILEGVETALSEASGSGRSPTQEQPHSEQEKTGEDMGLPEQPTNPSGQVQVTMELSEDGSLNMDMIDGSQSEIMTEAGLFIQDKNGTLTVGEMYLDESFGMKYDTQQVEQLLNEIREAMLEEVR